MNIDGAKKQIFSLKRCLWVELFVRLPTSVDSRFENPSQWPLWNLLSHFMLIGWILLGLNFLQLPKNTYVRHRRSKSGWKDITGHSEGKGVAVT
jgi:hypothetical protein